MTFGTCRYCGQVVNLDYEEETQAEADIAASEKCECYDARHERNLRKQITAARETAAAFNVPMHHHEPVVKGGAEILPPRAINS